MSLNNSASGATTSQMKPQFCSHVSYEKNHQYFMSISWVFHHVSLLFDHRCLRVRWLSVQGQDGRHQQGRANLQTDGASGCGGAPFGSLLKIKIQWAEKPWETMIIHDNGWGSWFFMNNIMIPNHNTWYCNGLLVGGLELIFSRGVETTNQIK